MHSDPRTSDRLTPILGDCGLQISLPDGPTYFNYYWLRDADPSAIDPDTRERVFDIAGLARSPRARSAHVDGDMLIVDWADEDHVSRVPMAMLSEFSIGGRQPDPAALPRRPWYSGAYETFARFRQCEIEQDDATRQAFARALIEGRYCSGDAHGGQ